VHVDLYVDQDGVSVVVGVEVVVEFGEEWSVRVAFDGLPEGADRKVFVLRGIGWRREPSKNAIGVRGLDEAHEVHVGDGQTRLDRPDPRLCYS
jgi:hypothetical protein